MIVKFKIIKNKIKTTSIKILYDWIIFEYIKSYITNKNINTYKTKSNLKKKEKKINMTNRSPENSLEKLNTKISINFNKIVNNFSYISISYIRP